MSVKRVLTIVLAWASLVLMLSFVAAGSFKSEPVTEADALPAYEIVTTVRSMGLRPSDEPVRRGPYYVLHATDARGTTLRVVADAQFGDILSVAPTQNAATPSYQRGPHIIHVPQAGTRDERTNTQASVSDRDVPDATENDDEEEAAPPPRRRVAPVPQRQDNSAPHPRAPRWQPRSETPPLPAEGPTPDHPTPRFSAKVDPAGKFGQPHDSRSSAPPLPPGYTSPSALPHSD